jgi:hypothetical protein
MLDLAYSLAISVAGVQRRKREMVEDSASVTIADGACLM